MELKKLSEHTWYMPYESERDRPNLGYVKGKNWSLAIDAGHSAAHTDDSTLVYIENDKTLFLGDATCKDFTIGKKDPALCKKLADTICRLNPQTCMEGHWMPVETDDTLNDLLNGI